MPRGRGAGQRDEEGEKPHAAGEHVLAEEEAVAIVRGQVDELSGGGTPPY